MFSKGYSECLPVYALLTVQSAKSTLSFRCLQCCRRFASAEGPLLALQGLPSLRELTLDELPDTRSLQHFVPLLTQLTCLEIACRDDTGALPLCCWDNGTPAPPLPALTGLRHLELRRFQAQDDFAAAALPGQLTYLKVSQPQGSLPAWWEQVGRCQALQELHVELQVRGAAGERRNPTT
jgi:hypothetical protein